MTLLRDILYKVPLTSTSGNMQVELNSIAFDSGKVGKGSLFIAVKGRTTDGHAYFDSAIRKGAVAIVCEILPNRLEDGITYVTVSNSAFALGIIAANFYGNPSEKFDLVGITGTNGKTTTATLLYHLFLKLGYKTGLLSTIENKINERTIATTHTTSDPIRLNELLDEMLKEGCTHCFMEVSSHAIDQHRIEGLQFAGAVFTNISHDHLDYHKTFDAYIKVKKKFFDDLHRQAFALVNTDDRRSQIMLQNTKAIKQTYALKSVADFKGKLLTSTLEGIEMEIENSNAWFKLIGHFNGYNLLAAYATAVLLGENADEVLRQLSVLDPVPGRFQQVVSASDITAIVDYAHTPDALKNVLETINSFRTGNEQLITVVGCGGNRDKKKRPLMASIAIKLSNKVVLTSDNPRDENPDTIINDMKKGGESGGL